MQVTTSEGTSVSDVRIERVIVRRVLAERPGAIELEVAVDGRVPSEALAIAYPTLTGRPEPGDAVLLNTSAVSLGLGTGGWHFVMALDRKSTRLNSSH